MTTPYSDPDRDPPPTPRRPTTVLITCDSQPGCLVAFREDGMVSTNARELAPEWAQGITKVLVQSRLAFYRPRVAPDQLEIIRDALAINLRDLDYIKVDEDGDDIEVSADPEWRMEFLAGLYGVTRTDELDQERYGPDRSILAQVEIGMDSARTSDEGAAFKLAQVTFKRRVAGD